MNQATSKHNKINKSNDNTTHNDIYLGYYTDEMLFEYVENIDMDKIENTQPSLFQLTQTENTKTNLINKEIKTQKTKEIKLEKNMSNKGDILDMQSSIPYKNLTTTLMKRRKLLDSNKKNTFDNSKIKKIQSRCPTCSSNEEQIKVIDGKIICINCGRVISIKLDNHIESRIFGKEEGTLSANTGYSLVSTSMLPGYINTNVVGNSAYNKMNKLNLWNNVMSADEKNVLKAFRHIKDICYKEGFSKKIEDSTKSLYMNLKKCVNNNDELNEANKRKINREDKVLIMVAICIKIACRSHGFNYNNYKIAQICNISVKLLTKGEKLYLEIIRESEIEANIEQPEPHELALQLCTSLKIPENYTNAIVSTCKNIEMLYASSNSAPQSLAATATYIITFHYRLPISIENIAELAFMAPSTIDKCYKKMTPYLSIIVNTEASTELAKDITSIIETIPIPTKFEAMYENIKQRNQMHQNL